MDRKKCSIEGCYNLARNKGFYKGKIRYGNTCEKHHKNKYSPEKIKKFLRKDIPNNKCDICGWDKAPCDRHRIDPESGYTIENVRILCPNCHRLHHLGIITI